MRRTPTTRALLALLAFSLIAAGCGGRDDDKASSGGGGDKPTDTSGGETADTLIDTADCPDNGTAGINGDTISMTGGRLGGGPITGNNTALITRACDETAVISAEKRWGSTWAATPTIRSKTAPPSST